METDKKMDQIEKQITTIINKECNTCHVKQFDINAYTQCKTNCIFNRKLAVLYEQYRKF